MIPGVTPTKLTCFRWRGAGTRALALLFGMFLLVIALLMLFENHLLFHPVKAEADWLKPPDPAVQDVEFRSADGVRIHAWWWPRNAADGVLLYSHGNAGNLSHRGELLIPWRDQLNLSVLIFDYPGYGKSEGKPSERGCYAAADAAYDWLVGVKHIAPERILLYGRSLGGGVATDLASRRSHRALILGSAFTSVPDMAQTLFPWLPARWLVRNRFDNLVKIKSLGKPVYISHGDRDDLVPISQGRQLFEAAPDPKSFFVMPGCDHNDPPPIEFYIGVKEFLARAEAARPP